MKLGCNLLWLIEKGVLPCQQMKNCVSANLKLYLQLFVTMIRCYGVMNDASLPKFLNFTNGAETSPTIYDIIGLARLHKLVLISPLQVIFSVFHIHIASHNIFLKYYECIKLIKQNQYWHGNMMHFFVFFVGSQERGNSRKSRAGSKYVFFRSSEVASLFSRFQVKLEVNGLVDNKHASTSQVKKLFFKSSHKYLTCLTSLIK